MKKFMILTYGFEKPTPEVMAAWSKWFEAIADKIADQGGFPRGREISRDGTKDLPMEEDSITGYLIVNAADLDEAEAMAQGCPFITSTRIYEIMTK